MTHKHIGRIGATLGLALSIAGCSPSRTSTDTAASKAMLRPTTAETTGVGDSTHRAITSKAATNTTDTNKTDTNKTIH